MNKTPGVNRIVPRKLFNRYSATQRADERRGPEGGGGGEGGWQVTTN